MSESDVDLFHDGQLDAAGRAAFLERAATDPGLADDLAFRANLDERLRAAFGSPPDVSGIIGPAFGTPTRGGRSRWSWLAIAAVLLVGTFAIVFANPGDDRVTISAEELWKELDPIMNCKAPVLTKDDQFTQFFSQTHGAGLKVQAFSGALVHGPVKCAAEPSASLFTVVLPMPDGQPPDIRMVLVGCEAEVKPSGDLLVFHRTLRGVPLVEITTATSPRALSLFY
jgi:hypothetical protein